jgi:hypothetical protein
VAVLFEAPSEFLAIKFSISAVVHASENSAKTADTISTSLLENNEDLVENLIGRLSVDAKDRVDIRVVS